MPKAQNDDPTKRGRKPLVSKNGNRLRRITVRCFEEQYAEFIRRGGNTAFRAWLDAPATRRF